VAKKVELEASFREYSAQCAEASQAELDHDYPRMLARAEATLPLLGEAIAYLRRYQEVEVPRLPSVAQILRYAPPMFARRSLDAVAEWQSQTSRTDRKAYPELPHQLQAARRVLALATRIWPSWRAAAPVLAADDDANEVAQLITFWMNHGSIVRWTDKKPEMLQLVTHPRRDARGKCARCGHETQAKWMELLDEKVCSHCRATSHFVIVARVA
jgi:hypothetical protein